MFFRRTFHSAGARRGIFEPKRAGHFVLRSVAARTIARACPRKKHLEARLYRIDKRTL